MSMRIKNRLAKIKNFKSKENRQIIEKEAKQENNSKNTCFLDLEEFKNSEDLMKMLENECIGNDAVFKGPFGTRKVVYCDFTASGKSVRPIEDFISREVLPFYANVHTSTSISSMKTSAFRAQARQIIRECVKATEDDVVLFVGSGLTGAINKLIHNLHFKRSPVVLISPYEHHSNILPWIEIGAEVVYSIEDENGNINMDVLESQLQKYKATGRPMVGSFSSASNVTGVLTDVDAVATLLHRYGAFAFFDYATAGPYVEINMNPKEENGSYNVLSYKDAVFCSVHKFLGGPQTPGLLVCKRHLFANSVSPSEPGGGTVKFVDHRSHVYVDNVEEREEGGTPSIVESIRAGLAFRLKEMISVKLIMQREHELAREAMDRLERMPNIKVLGTSACERLPIFSFVVKHAKSKRYLHHNFVATLMNDLFGLQVRGGCSCAGPYATDLLGISEHAAESIKQVLQGIYVERIDNIERRFEGKIYEILKPGFVRFNLPFFFSRYTIDYIFDAVEFIAEHAWKFLPLYDMNPEFGSFQRKRYIPPTEDVKLTDFLSGNNIYKSQEPAVTFEESLLKANKMVKFVKILLKNSREEAKNDTFLSANLDTQLRWFLLPSEAHSFVIGRKLSTNYTPLFTPRDRPGAVTEPIVYNRLSQKLCRSTDC